MHSEANQLRSGQHSLGGAEPTSQNFVDSEETIDEETAKSAKPGEVNSLVDSARFWCAAGNSRQDDLHDTRLMDIPHCTARICEIASFWNFVEKGKHNKTHPDMDDGLGRVTPAGREYSRLRREKGSTVLGVIPERTVIGPVQQFVIAKSMGTYGIEIEIPSPTRPGKLTWAMMCRGYTRYVDEVSVPKRSTLLPAEN